MTKLVAWLIATAALLAVVGAIWTTGYRHGRADVQAQWDKAKAVASAAASKAASDRSAEQHRLAIEQHDAAVAADKKSDALRATVARGDALARELRSAYLTVASRCAVPQTASSAPGGPPTANPEDVRADVLGRCVEEYRAMAAESDRRGIAGSACEQIGYAQSK